MAVQKSKKSRARGGMRRSHGKVILPSISTYTDTGEQHIRHHMTAQGFYRGKQIITTTAAVDDTLDTDVEAGDPQNK